MKTLDKMIIKGFILPFIATFFIALFILTMQFLWVWVDDLVGKGVGVLIILELLFYLLLSFFPIAFPIAVLLSSVMLMGGYAERYELSSMTSSGLSLLRVMKPLIILSFFIALMSFGFSNYLWPLANLKYKSRLLDIKNQKPTLSIQKGVFNRDFTGYVIKVDDKEDDGKTVKGIMIYDNQRQLDKLNLMTARTGEMFTEPKENLFVMKLYDGHQYQEITPQGGTESKYPFVRMNFKEYTKVFDMSQFDFNRTDENLYKTHQTMMSLRQLKVAVDSIDKRMNKAINEINSTVSNSLHSKYGTENRTFEISSGQDLNRQYFPQRDVRKMERIKKERLGINDNSPIPVNDIPLIGGSQRKLPLVEAGELFVNRKYNPEKSLISQVQDKYKLATANFAISLANSSLSTIELQSNIYAAEYDSRVRHIFEMNVKFAYSVICIVFLFIGAPMGAIVRKGGFGYPLLIAIIFYMIYQVLFTIMKKSADSFVIAAWLAPWIPVITMSLIGFLLTRRAMSDGSMNLEIVTKVISNLFEHISKRYFQFEDYIFRKFKLK
ncbi:MAG: LptF/LptG family permease [Saprospiraceae bacterium]|nr:LptF/LptG family permease [Saprospiraceae bacterium]